MCRRNSNRCVLLGEDPSSWSRFEPLPAHPSLLESFPHFVAAVRAAAAGDLDGARAALRLVQSDAIKEWYIEHAQVSGNARFHALKRSGPAPYSGDVDELAYPRSRMVGEILARDGYRCRYCQRQVVHKDVLRLVQALVGPSTLPIGPTNLATHGAVIAYRAVVDHVKPRKQGGRTEPDNLVTACYPCNFGKANHVLEDLALDPPRPPLRDGWEGLQSLVPAMKARRHREP